jgi:hypothetical protein
MAWIGRYSAAENARKALDDAVKAAAEGGDGYRRLTVMAWPVRAAIERGQSSLAERWLKAALKDITSVEPMPSRAETLWWLWAAAFPGGPRLRDPVRAAALAHCPPDCSWRAERLYRYMVATLASASSDDAQSLIDALPEGKPRSRLQRRRAAGELGAPQPFFW